MLVTILQRRLDMLQRNVALIRQRIDKYPQGQLKINRIKDEYYYSIVDRTSGKKKYIRKENIKQAKLIAQRDYEKEYLKRAGAETSVLKKLLEIGLSRSTQTVFSALHPGRKCLVAPLEITDEEYINRWISTPYIPKGFEEDDTTEYYTERGERVRSKSEVIIADILYKLQIPYKYECPLKLDNVTVYPDFTILNIKDRSEMYLEHFGMMGDIDYVSNMMLKLTTYERNGIYIGDRLIFTAESLERPLNINIIRNKLKNYRPFK